MPAFPQVSFGLCLGRREEGLGREDTLVTQVTLFNLAQSNSPLAITGDSRVG